MHSHGFRSLYLTRHLMAQPHRHNDVELNFIEAGALTYLLGGRTVVLAADHLYLFWAAMPHQIIHVGPETRHRVLTVPLRDFLAMNLPDPFERAVLHGDPVTDGGQDSVTLNRLQFQRWHDHLTQESPDHSRIVRLEVEACLRRMALAQPSGSASAQTPAPQVEPHLPPGKLDHVRAMVAYITDHYRESLDVEEIAAAAGLHPNYAMQIFRNSVNMTVIDYLTQYRLAHAQRLLLTTDKPVLDVALDCGFGSVSRFYAVFKSLCGQTPGHYRRSQTHGQRLTESRLVSLLATLDAAESRGDAT